MTRRLTPTLGICLAAGVAAGIALARPATTPVTTPAPQPAAAVAPADREYGADDARIDATAPQPASIQIADFAFAGPASVAPGATVTVTNADGAPHTVTADGGAFDTGAIDGGASTTFTAPTAPGSYPYACAIHPSMTGVLVVQ